jgi:hypothetical protein
MSSGVPGSPGRGSSGGIGSVLPGGGGTGVGSRGGLVMLLSLPRRMKKGCPPRAGTPSCPRSAFRLLVALLRLAGLLVRLLVGLLVLALLLLTLLALALLLVTLRVGLLRVAVLGVVHG